MAYFQLPFPPQHCLCGYTYSGVHSLLPFGECHNSSSCSHLGRKLVLCLTTSLPPSPRALTRGWSLRHSLYQQDRGHYEQSPLTFLPTNSMGLTTSFSCQRPCTRSLLPNLMTPSPVLRPLLSPWSSAALLQPHWTPFHLWALARARPMKALVKSPNPRGTDSYVPPVSHLQAPTCHFPSPVRDLVAFGNHALHASLPLPPALAHGRFSLNIWWIHIWMKE